MKVALHFFNFRLSAIETKVALCFLLKVVFSTLYADVKEPLLDRPLAQGSGPTIAGPLLFRSKKLVWFEFSGS
jgi:hypothetical protein